MCIIIELIASSFRWKSVGNEYYLWGLIVLLIEIYSSISRDIMIQSRHTGIPEIDM